MSRYSRISSQRSGSPGHLVVFEGPDGVGKTTISKLLVKDLSNRGIKCVWLSFPGHEIGTLGSEIYKLHHDTRFAQIPPISMQLMHVAAHIELLQRRILPELAAGTWVVLDRYWWSTWAYGMVRGANPSELQLALRIERQQWAKVHPTVAFLLRRKIVDADADHAVLRKYYRQIATRQKSEHPINIILNNRTIEDALRRVSTVVSPFFSKQS